MGWPDRQPKITRHHLPGDGELGLQKSSEEEVKSNAERHIDKGRRSGLTQSSGRSAIICSWVLLAYTSEMTKLLIIFLTNTLA